MKSKDSKAIVVLGMHRSGTSAIAGALSLLGVDFGKEEKLIGSMADTNARGHWEHREIVMLNEQLLTSIGIPWDDFRIIEESHYNSSDVKNIKAKILDILNSNFRDSDLWGIKDPRICKLLPIWNDIFHELGVTPVYVIIFRHPDEVSNSLEKRNSFKREKSHLLWLSYNLLAEKYSRAYSRIFISYDDLLKDWKNLVDKINDCPDVELNVDNINTDKITGFLSPELRHSFISNEDSKKDNCSWANNMYQDLYDISTGILDEDSLRAKLESMYQTFTIASSLYGNLLFDQASAYSEIKNQQNIISNMTVEYENIRNAYNDLETAYKSTQEAYEQTHQAFEHTYQAYEQTHQAYEIKNQEVEKLMNQLCFKLRTKLKNIIGL